MAILTLTSIISDASSSGNSQDAARNEYLNKVFLKISKSGLKLNKNKCQIG